MSKSPREENAYHSTWKCLEALPALAVIRLPPSVLETRPGGVAGRIPLALDLADGEDCTRAGNQRFNSNVFQTVH